MFHVNDFKCKDASEQLPLCDLEHMGIRDSAPVIIVYIENGFRFTGVARYHLDKGWTTADGIPMAKLCDAPHKVVQWAPIPMARQEWEERLMSENALAE